MKEEIESRFHLLIAISLFFPVLLYNLGRITEHTDGQSILLSIQTSILVGFYLLNYILFQVRKDFLKDGSLKRIGEWLLVSLGVFIVPILCIALGTVSLPDWIAAPIAFISSTAVI